MSKTHKVDIHTIGYVCECKQQVACAGLDIKPFYYKKVACLKNK